MGRFAAIPERTVVLKFRDEWAGRFCPLTVLARACGGMAPRRATRLVGLHRSWSGRFLPDAPDVVRGASLPSVPANAVESTGRSSTPALSSRGRGACDTCSASALAERAVTSLRSCHTCVRAPFEGVNMRKHGKTVENISARLAHVWTFFPACIGSGANDLTLRFKEKRYKINK